MGCVVSAPIGEASPKPTAVEVAVRGARPSGVHAVATRPAMVVLPPGYAIMVACNAYTRVPGLKGAVADAVAMSQVLQKLGFRILCTLYDEACTPESIEGALRTAAESLPESARLLVFFAGHGMVHTKTGRVFYGTPHTDPTRLLTTGGWDLQRLHSLRDFLPRHQLFILDFCFSGAAVVRTRSTYNDFSAPSVQFFSAGAADQRVSEVSTFLTHSPLCTPFGTPEHSPEPSPQPSPRNNGAHAGFFGNAAQRLHSVPPSAHFGGIFASTFVAVLRAVHAHKQAAHGVGPRHVTMTEVFSKVRRRVLSWSKRHGLKQTPLLERSPWWRDRRAEGDFMF